MMNDNRKLAMFNSIKMLKNYKRAIEHYLQEIQVTLLRVETVITALECILEGEENEVN